MNYYEKVESILPHPASELVIFTMIYASVALLSLLALASGKIYFKENFNDKAWESRWTSSDLKPKVS